MYDRQAILAVLSLLVPLFLTQVSDTSRPAREDCSSVNTDSTGRLLKWESPPAAKYVCVKCSRRVVRRQGVTCNLKHCTQACCQQCCTQSGALNQRTTGRGTIDEHCRGDCDLAVQKGPHSLDNKPAPLPHSPKIRRQYCSASSRHSRSPCALETSAQLHLNRWLALSAHSCGPGTSNARL